MGAIYDWIDANIAGGLLPGGHPLGEAGATIGGVIPTPFVGVQPAAPTPTPQVGAQVPAVIGAGLGGILPAGGVAMPGVPAAPRGRLQTLVARVLPGGQVIPVRAFPGRPALMSSDITAAKRVKRVLKIAGRLFPTRRAKSVKYTYRTSRKKSKKG